ncbi:MAG TPA: Hpt domain-containing protein, partial [Burkholderiales bacterium]|nr:Hpt domain-containing protein [Burkholderiales bacterium]
KGGTHLAELAPQIELLKKIADTLGVLGLGTLRANVQAEIQELQNLVASGGQLTDAMLVQMAATLISVEDSLDDQLVRLILPGAAPAVPAESMEGTSEVVSADDTDYRQVTEAVLRECIVNLARVKETITQALQKPGEAQGLDAVPQLLRGINAGLLMLGKGRAVEIVEKAGGHVQAMLEPGARLAADRLDRLADAIVSIEYYMETVQSGRSDPWYMLDNAEGCLKALAELPAPIPSGLPDDAGVHTRTIALDRAQALGPRAASDAAATHPSAAPAPEPELDPEFVALFIEEAKEEIASIARLFPMWEQNPAETDALVHVRRSFHTLKGSGRMVGAKRIGEFAWAAENLLNRIINKTLVRTPGMVRVLREAVAELPGLVQQLEAGGDVSPNVAGIMSRAHAYAEGREPDAAGGSTADDLAAADAFAESTSFTSTPGGVPATGAAAIPRPTTPAQPAMDPVLHEIYSRETAGHLASIRDFIARCANLPPPWEVPEAIYRACHTLSGSSKMAEARQGIKIAEPLNHYMRKVFENGMGLSREGLAVLEDAVRAIEDVIANINESTGYFVSHRGIVERIRALDEEIDREIALRQVEASLPSLKPDSPEIMPAHPVQAEEIELSSDEPAPAAQSMVGGASANLEEDDAGQEYDADIAAIFSEEATELLEAADVALREWNAARNDKERAFELKRQLHTLKGGARMAGIRAMGDLSHELETLVIQIDAGMVSADDQAY